MAGKKKEYQRLPGRKIFGLYRNSLWQGKDHLLSIKHRGYSEEYRRFYFSDIQAIVLRKTETGFWLTVVFGVLTMLCLIPLALPQAGAEWKVPFIILEMIFSPVFFYNLIGGTTCECHLYTAVNRELLPAWCRIRSARKGIAILKPYIEAVQGELRPEALVTAPVVAHSVSVITNSEAQEKSLRSESGYVHLSVFLLLLLYGGLIGFFSHARSDALHYLHVLLMGALLITVVLALVKQNHSDVPATMRWAIWMTLVFLWFLIMINSMLFMSRSAGGLPGLSEPFLLIHFIMAGIGTCLGALGLIGFLRFRSSKK